MQNIVLYLNANLHNFGIFVRRPFCQKFVYGYADNNIFFAYSREVSKILRCSLFGGRARKFAPNCFVLPHIAFFWGIALQVLISSRYFHDGWQRGLNHNNQTQKQTRKLKTDKTTLPNKFGKHGKHQLMAIQLAVCFNASCLIVHCFLLSLHFCFHHHHHHHHHHILC